MKRAWGLVGALLSLAPSSWAESQPGTLSVALFETDPAERAVAERVASELASEGYEVEWVESRPSPCESSEARASGEEHAWIRVGSASAFVCFRNANGRLSSAMASASNGEAATLALSTVEALNGLRSDPVEVSRPRELRAPVAPPPSIVTSSLAGGPSFAFAPPELPPLLGLRLEHQSGIHEHFSLVYDAFVALRPAEIERVDRRIDVRAAWMRIGPRLSAPLSIASVDASLLGGPALVWTTAQAEPPLIGSSDATAAGVASLGVGLELPRRSSWFLRVMGQGSVLFPRVTIEAGDGEVPSWVFVETSLSLGVRWNVE